MGGGEGSTGTAVMGTWGGLGGGETCAPWERILLSFCRILVYFVCVVSMRSQLF